MSAWNDDDVVDAVEELGPERRAQRLLQHRGRVSLLVAPPSANAWMNCEPTLLVMMTIAFWKLTDAALAVGEPPVVEHLQQHVEHVRVRLLDLVEQDHASRAGAAPPR